MMSDNWSKSLRCGDSKEIIKLIPDNSIDFIFTDPPYNIGSHSTGNIPLPGRTAINNDLASWDWEEFHPEDWVDDFIRILKPGGNLFIFTSYNQIGRWHSALDHRFDSSNFIVWHKTNPAPKIFKAGFLNSCELIFTCWNKGHTWNFISQAEMHNFIESPICMRPERLSNPKHPAQKPVSILKKLITIASNEGDIILDPFMGVGSIGVAALELNRRYIGFEIDRTYFEAAYKRIDMKLKEKTIQSSDIAMEPAIDYGRQLTFDFLIPGKKVNNDTDINIPDPSADNLHLEPIIKWPGGKEKELKAFKRLFPDCARFIEPFVGGGSVVMSSSGKGFVINDLSEELISLYRLIKEGNPQFFDFVDDIIHMWDNAGDFTQSHTDLVEFYISVRKDDDVDWKLKSHIDEFCHNNMVEIMDLRSGYFLSVDGVLLPEIKKNLTRKLCRMSQLEKERSILPSADIAENIEAAVKSSIYMYLRDLYNRGADSPISPLQTALFLFIRNYCYSGMFRYNDKGDFNVPYGGIAYNSKSLRKKVDFYQNPVLKAKLAHTEIYNTDFEDFLRTVRPEKNDFVFLDPPYDSDFSTYAKNVFSRDDQRRLADYLINRCQARWMVVIKHTDFIYNLYNRPGINIRSFDKKYTVSFMNRNDKSAIHLIITNY